MSAESARIRFLIEAVNKTEQPFKQAEVGLTTLNKARLEANTLVFAEQRAQQFLISTYRQKYSAVYDTLGLMRSVGSIGNQIISLVNSENLSQMRLRDTLLDVEAAQRMVNTAMELYGEDSVQYQAAWDNLTDAANRHRDALDADEWQDLAMTLGIAGAIGQVGLLITKLGELYIKAGGLTGISLTLAGLVTSAAATALAVGGIVVGGLSVLGTMGPPETPGVFDDLMPEGMDPLTKEDIMAGEDYIDKYAAWRKEEAWKQQAALELQRDEPWGGAERRESGGGNITVNAYTNASPDDIADAALRAYEEMERRRR